MSENRRRLNAIQLAEWLEQFVFSAAQGIRAETSDALDRCIDSGNTDEMETLVNRIILQPDQRLDMLAEMGEVVEQRLNELRQLHFERCESLATTLRVLWGIDLPAAAVRDLVSGARDSDLAAMMTSLAADSEEDPDNDEHPMNQLAELALVDENLHLISYLFDFISDWQIAMEMIAFRSAWERPDAHPFEYDWFGIAQ